MKLPCDDLPTDVERLLFEVGVLRAEVERLREVLRWYAECPDRWDFAQDDGERARRALDRT